MIFKVPIIAKGRKKVHARFPLKGKTGIKYKSNAIFAIRAMGNGLLPMNQLEAIRKKLIRPIKKADFKLIIRPHITYSRTSKPLQVRMGKGKGNPSLWVAQIRKGQILFEVTGKNVRLNIVREWFHKVKYRLSIISKLTKKYISNIFQYKQVPTPVRLCNSLKMNRFIDKSSIHHYNMQKIKYLGIYRFPNNSTLFNNNYRK
jgi:large subunit ribosomal protein L16